MFDQYSLLHFASGVTAYFWGVGPGPQKPWGSLKRLWEQRILFFGTSKTARALNNTWGTNGEHMFSV